MLTMFNSKKDFAERHTSIAILPVGATEQHGNHLPVGTDTIVVEQIARLLAEKLDAYLLPALPITSSIEHRKAKGTVYLRADTLAAVVRDIAGSINYSGFAKLVVVNGHGGNWILKPTIRDLNRTLSGTQVVLLDTPTLFSRVHEVVEHTDNDIHAGEAETSLMLHLHSDLVGEVSANDRKSFVPQAYLDYFDISEITDEGYWGYPESATSEKGERIMSLMIESALAYLHDLDATTRRVGDQAQSDRPGRGD